MKSNSTQKDYTIWVQVDKTLPWFELEDTYKTLPDAWRAVEQITKSIKLKVVKTPPLTSKKGVLTVTRYLPSR
jgi:hypothetical protein